MLPSSFIASFNYSSVVSLSTSSIYCNILVLSNGVND
nr:MAG TPA: hypothetical protein [Bacteriophage sp.]